VIRSTSVASKRSHASIQGAHRQDFDLESVPHAREVTDRTGHVELAGHVLDEVEDIDATHWEPSGRRKLAAAPDPCPTRRQRELDAPQGL
jgi:hypothetical protein